MSPRACIAAHSIKALGIERLDGREQTDEGRTIVHGVFRSERLPHHTKRLVNRLAAIRQE